MAERSRDWMNQAEKDLEKANLDLEWKYYEWACFTAHQSAEKALKALFQHLHGEAWGHGIKSLLENTPFEDHVDLLNDGRLLDKLYIPTRYPNGLPAGIPHDYFTKEDAQQAVEAAARIHAWCKDKISE